MNIKHLGNQVKKYRKKNGLTQEKLSEQANVSLKFIQEIEASEDFPSIDLFIKLTEIMKVRPSTLLIDDGTEEEQITEDTTKILPLSTTNILLSQLLKFSTGEKQITLGNRIAEYREVSGLSRKDLSNIAGISASQIGNIESGTQFTTLKSLVSLANSLNAPIEYLLQDSCKNAAIDSFASILVTAKEKLTAPQYEAFLNIHRSLQAYWETIEACNSHLN